MRSSDDRKAQMELAVAQQFARIAPLGIDAGSLVKRDEPEPDIRCQTTGGALTLELVELLDESVAKEQGDAGTLHGAMTRALETAPLSSLTGRLARVAFLSSATTAKKRTAVPGLIETLAALPAGYLGPIALPPTLAATVTCLEVVPWADGCDLMVAVYAGGGWIEPVGIAAVRAKFGKSYQTDAPIELLAYYQRQPVGADLWSHPQLCDLLRSRVPGSLFRRGWIFDTWSGNVLFAWPPVQPEAKASDQPGLEG